MTSRVQITFRHVLPTDAVREIVDQKFGKLCSLLPTNARCHVVVDRASAGSPRGAFVCARVDIHGAGIQICTEGRSTDTCQAVRAAFERASAQSQRTPTERLRSRWQSGVRMLPPARS